MTYWWKLRDEWCKLVLLRSIIAEQGIKINFNTSSAVETNRKTLNTRKGKTDTRHQTYLPSPQVGVSDASRYLLLTITFIRSFRYATQRFFWNIFRCLPRSASRQEQRKIFNDGSRLNGHFLRAFRDKWHHSSAPDEWFFKLGFIFSIKCVLNSRNARVSALINT